MDARAGQQTAEHVVGAGGALIAYEAAGPAGAPTVLLVHGFASDRRSNWVRTRWVSTLVDAGFRVIAPDLRGHGDSARPRNLAAYALPAFREDLTAVLDAEAPAKGATVHLVGYSLGARLVHDYAQAHPERVRSITMGGPPIDGSFAGFDLAAATSARHGSGKALNAETARYLGMASSAGNDPEALLRLAEAVRRRAFGPRSFQPRAGAAEHPLFIVAGDDDPVHEGARMLAEQLSGARFLGLPGRDHVSAVTSRVFRTAVVEFLSEVEQEHPSSP